MVVDDVRTGAGTDLVVIALSRVQAFITESRTTADLSVASVIIAELGAIAAKECRKAPGAHVVFPVDDSAFDGAAGEAADGGMVTPGAPNRVVALVASGTGAEIARRAVDAIEAQWARWVFQVMGRAVPTPGMPCVQWVCIPAEAGDYRTRWRLARSALTARRRIRDFDAPPDWPSRRLCTQSPQWPAEIGKDAPPNLKKYERDALCAANWVKRRWNVITQAVDVERVRFPSTSAIASAPYRLAVLEALSDPKVHAAVEDLRQLVEYEMRDRTREAPVPALAGQVTQLARWFAEAAGPWVYPTAWQAEVMKREFADREQAGSAVDFDAVARQGRGVLGALTKSMTAHGTPPITSYLAVIAQDLDGMGRFLDGEEVAGRFIEVTAGDHANVSRELRATATRQRRAIVGSEALGVPVYLGGDDLLAFAPAAHAVTMAGALRRLIPASLPNASTAVLFFHRTSSLRRVVAEAQRLLGESKSAHPDKDAIGVGFLRRSGAREHSIQPWFVAGGTDMSTDLFDVFARGTGHHGLSPRLVEELDRDGKQFAMLAEREGDLYRDEIRRLVRHHGGDIADANALLTLGASERGTTGEGHPGGPTRSARVAVFIRQECRRVRS